MEHLRPRPGGGGSSGGGANGSGATGSGATGDSVETSPSNRPFPTMTFCPSYLFTDLQQLRNMLENERIALDSECEEALRAAVSSREQAALFTPTGVLNCVNHVFSTVTRRSDQPIPESDQALVLLRPFRRRAISLREPAYRQADPVPVLPGSVYLPSEYFDTRNWYHLVNRTLKELQLKVKDLEHTISVERTERIDECRSLVSRIDTEREQRITSDRCLTTRLQMEEDRVGDLHLGLCRRISNECTERIIAVGETVASISEAVASINDERTERGIAINDERNARIDGDERIHNALALINTEEEVNRQRWIRNIGTCDSDFDFVRIEGGYQCTGGGHRVTDAELALGKAGKKETNVEMTL
ncbi:hypothetical protein BGX38DRAFT_1278789 [Terfezia claveryi]|nr:hypothetical protein BGX38DRAFT_1278789 [Terfezia claveryi]